MIRQYRIDRFDGLEVLVCEVYRKHTLTQSEYEAFQAWREAFKPSSSEVFLLADFRAYVDSEFHKEGVDTVFGLRDVVPEFDVIPAVVLRGVIVDNRIASLQVHYVSSVLPVEVVDEVNRFYGVLDSRHWRNMISRQVSSYGSLFAAADD